MILTIDNDRFQAARIRELGLHEGDVFKGY